MNTDMTTVQLMSADNPGPYTGTGNNTWLIDGPEPTLIDAGVGKPMHVAAIAAALGERPLVRVLVTHGHGDHASGVPALRERWPLLDAYKWVLDGEQGWSRLTEGMEIVAGTRTLRVVETPGHAADHVCLFDVASSEVFIGDMLIQRGSVLIPAGKGGNLRAYLGSLHRLAGLSPTRFYPGHGPVIDRPLDVIAEALDHRRRREEQVLACLAEGVSDPDAIVTRLYVGLADGLDRAARMTVVAHLDKLRDDGRLSR